MPATASASCHTALPRGGQKKGNRKSWLLYHILYPAEQQRISTWIIETLDEQTTKTIVLKALGIYSHIYSAIDVSLLYMSPYLRSYSSTFSVHDLLASPALVEVPCGVSRIAEKDLDCHKGCWCHLALNMPALSIQVRT